MVFHFLILSTSHYKIRLGKLNRQFSSSCCLCPLFHRRGQYITSKLTDVGRARETGSLQTIYDDSFREQQVNHDFQYKVFVMHFLAHHHESHEYCITGFKNILSKLGCGNERQCQKNIEWVEGGRS